VRRRRFAAHVARASASSGSTRFTSPQPNVPGQGIIAAYSVRFWALIVGLGVLTGLGASALIALLHLAEHLSYGYHSGPFIDAVRRASGPRHVVVLLLAAGLVILGLAGLRRLPHSGGSEVSEAIWLRRARVALVPSLARGLLSIVTVGMGVSLGREAAPQLTGAATASRLADWASPPLWQRRLLVAAGAGAGFAAVYNVPLGGALLAVEVFLGSLALPLVLPALATSVIATAVAWTTLGTAPTYSVPTYALSAQHVVWAVLIGPVLGLAAVAWVRLIARASAWRSRGRRATLVPIVVFAALGLLSIPYPGLLGNGQDVVQLAVLGRISLGLLAILLVLKPLATAACLSTGAPGGLFTPTFTVGVLIAGVGGTVFSHIWSGPPLGSYALIGGGAFLAAAMQGPVAGTVLVLELSRHLDDLMVPTLVAVVGATVVARRLGAASIYSARLAPEPGLEVRASAGAAALASLDALDDSLPEVPARAPDRP
jgi:chloride channel protein, CIC family